MKISLKRQTKTYTAGDEVTVQISEAKIANNNLALKLNIVENGSVSNTFFYKTIGSFLEKGRYYFEQLLNALGAPEDGEIDLKWFEGKRFDCILAENEWQGKTRLDIGTYIEKKEEIDTVSSFWEVEGGSDNDVPFYDDEDEETEETPTKKTKTRSKKSATSKKETPESMFPQQTEDYVKLMEE